MKLSKQERIAAIVVIILVILVAGVFIFIKPNIETILATKASLEAKRTEYEEDVAKANTKDQLKTQILSAYDKGKDLADMFFPELTPYEADNEFRAFLDQCANRSNILVEDLTVSNPGTAGLTTSVFTPSSTKYALKDYVNQGAETTEDPNLLRQRMIQTNLGDAQTIGATTVSFTLYALTVEDLLTFADEVNNYELTENGKTVRKAIELNGVGFEDLRTKYILEKRGNESLADLISASNTAFSEYVANLGSTSRSALAEPTAAPATPAAPTATPDNTATDPDGDADSPSAPGNAIDGELTNAEEQRSFHQYSLNCTITFYSIERMQDPTATLAEQDQAAVAAPAAQ